MSNKYDDDDDVDLKRVKPNCDRFRENAFMHSGDTSENSSQSAYLTIGNLAVTLTFDL